MLQSHNKTIFEALGRNPIHPFPARMSPGIALAALGDGDATLRVLDPMAGSGTVLAVARVKGHRAFGVDVDPLAVLLARVWTSSVESNVIVDKAAEVLDRARAIFGSLSVGLAYPDKSDEETRRFIRYWFDEYARRQLAALAMVIAKVRDASTRDVLWCAFSRLIITKQAGASRAMDLSHSRPHKTFERAPVKPFAKFLNAVETVVKNCVNKGTDDIGPPTVVRQGDARALTLPRESIDLVLTSPPYLNAIDYLRCSKFSLVWMGHNVAELRVIRARSVGSEVSVKEACEDKLTKEVLQGLRLTPKLSSRNYALLAHYTWDILAVLKEISRVLRWDGRAVFVVGDSTIRETFVRNSSIIARAAQAHKLSLASVHSRELPSDRRYLPPPTKKKKKKLHARMRKEVVMVFNKVGGSKAV